jgi:hypothetical protein
MDVSPIDIIIFAPLAGVLGVLLFWFIQLLFIESLKFFLSKIKTRHEPFCRFTNLIGIIFQSICHALGFTVTRSGIAQFKITIHYGKVKPKKQREGFFEWISNTFLFIGPFFIPSFILFIILIFITPITIHIKTIITMEFFTFGNQLIGFGENLFGFSTELLTFLATLDLFHPIHLGFFILLLFFGLGIRPSYILKDKATRVDMLYDLKNIKSHLFQRPVYIVPLFVSIYIFYYITVILNINWYNLFFSFLGWLSIIATIAIFIAHLIILFIHVTDEIKGIWHYVPFIVLPISYILFRVIFYFMPIPNYLGLSLFLMCITTVITILLLYYFKTNRFKTKVKMKPLRVEDGPRRIIEQ